MAGSIDNPATFKKVICSARVIPGDEIRIVEEQNGLFVSVLNGTQENPILISKETNTDKIVGGISINGSYNKWNGIEICYNGFINRDSEFDDSRDMPLLYTVAVSAAESELNRCLIHDISHLGFWTSAINTKLTECLLWFNGWREPNGWYGHAIYTQNKTGIKIIKNCIIFMNYCDGLKLSGTDQAGVFSNYLFENCIFFDNGVMSYVNPSNGFIGGSGSPPYTNIILRGCEFYIRPERSGWGLSIGYTSGLDNFEITNCFFDAYLPIYIYPSVPYTNFTINNNLFYSSYTQRLYNTTEPAATLLADESNVWQQAPTSGKRVRLIISETGVRGHLVIYNYDLDNMVTVDASSLLTQGDSYRLTNVQDLFVDITEGVAGEGGVILVDMINRTMATPIGDITPVGSFPKFGCFILEKLV